MTKKKKSPRKWNRVHYFQRKKSNKHRVGHPVLVYGKRGRYSKYLLFTHTPDSDDYEKLGHNIDPSEDGKRDSWVKKTPQVSETGTLRQPDINYRIHNDDKERVKKYKK